MILINACLLIRFLVVFIFVMIPEQYIFGQYDLDLEEFSHNISGCDSFMLKCYYVKYINSTTTKEPQWNDRNENKEKLKKELEKNKEG